MEIWLKVNDKDAYWFAVHPSQVFVHANSIMNNVNINDLGNVSMFAGDDLRTVSFSSFFPNKKYNFLRYKHRLIPPYDVVKKIEQWRTRGATLRFIVTGTPINIPMRIESFSYGEKDGTGDVYYDISLKEHRKVIVKKVEPDKPTSDNNNRPEPDTKPPTDNKRTYKVKKGDTLWGIAKRYYGKGSEYPKIFNANRNILKDPNKIYPNQVLVIP